MESSDVVRLASQILKRFLEEKDPLERGLLLLELSMVLNV